MAKTEKAPNYSDADVERMVAMYRAGNSVQEIADSFTPARKPRSVIAKLVQLNEYVAKPKSVKSDASKSEGPSKKDLLARLETFGVNTKGLEPATKDALTEVISKLEVVSDATAIAMVA